MVYKIVSPNAQFPKSGELSYLNEESADLSYLRDKLIEGITFKPGVNIIIGKNGCGKSTVLNAIKEVNLCSDWFCPKLEPSLIGDKFKLSKAKPVFEAFNIECDYSKPIYNLYRMSEDWKAMNDEDTLFSKASVSARLAATSESKGQNQIGDFNQMIHTAYNKPAKSPIMLVNEEAHGFDYDSEAIEYYNEVGKVGDQYTFIMDEPDAGLDVDNLIEVSKFIEYMATDRDDTQIITAIHNAALINRLSAIESINWIELSDNYLEKVKSFCK